MVRPTVRRAIAMMDRTSAEARLAAERAVVLWSRRNLLRHAGIERRVRQGKSNVYAGHYDIASGQVTFWNEATSRFEPVVTVAAAGAEGGPETACCSPPCSRRRKDMLLGTVISQMQDETVALDTLLALDDLVLLARVREAADAHSVAPGEYVSDAIGRFINGADDEAWLALMTAAARAEDPGGAGLQVTLEHDLPTALEQQ